MCRATHPPMANRTGNPSPARSMWRHGFCAIASHGLILHERAGNSTGLVGIGERHLPCKLPVPYLLKSPPANNREGGCRILRGVQILSSPDHKTAT